MSSYYNTLRLKLKVTYLKLHNVIKRDHVIQNHTNSHNLTIFGTLKSWRKEKMKGDEVPRTQRITRNPENQNSCT